MKIFVYIPAELKNIRDIRIRFEKEPNEEEWCLEDGDIITNIHDSFLVDRYPNAKLKRFWCTFESVDSIDSEDGWIPIINEEYKITNSTIIQNNYTFRFKTLKGEDPWRYYSYDRICKITSGTEDTDLILSQKITLRRLFWLVMGNIALSKLAANNQEKNEDPKI